MLVLKCFCEYVSDVVIGVNVFECDVAHVHMLPEEVIFYIDVLDTLMERWIFG